MNRDKVFLFSIMVAVVTLSPFLAKADDSQGKFSKCFESIDKAYDAIGKTKPFVRDLNSFAILDYGPNTGVGILTVYSASGATQIRGKSCEMSPAGPKSLVAVSQGLASAINALSFEAAKNPDTGIDKINKNIVKLDSVQTEKVQSLLLQCQGFGWSSDEALKKIRSSFFFSGNPFRHEQFSDKLGEPKTKEQSKTAR